MDKYTKGYIHVAGREGGYWRSPNRGLTRNLDEAFVYTTGEYEEYRKAVRATERRAMSFEPVDQSTLKR